MSILAVSTVIYPPSLFTVTSSLGMEELDRKVVVTENGVAMIFLKLCQLLQKLLKARKGLKERNFMLSFVVKVVSKDSKLFKSLIQAFESLIS